MTLLLKKAFKEASKLSELEQTALARWLIDEIISQKKWEKAFAESEDVQNHWILTDCDIPNWRTVL